MDKQGTEVGPTADSHLFFLHPPDYGAVWTDLSLNWLKCCYEHKVCCLKELTDWQILDKFAPWSLVRITQSFMGAGTIPGMTLSFNCFLCGGTPLESPVSLKLQAGVSGLCKVSGNLHRTPGLLQFDSQLMFWDKPSISHLKDPQTPGSWGVGGFRAASNDEILAQEKTTCFYVGFLNKTAQLLDVLCTCEYFQTVSFNVVFS